MNFSCIKKSVNMILYFLWPEYMKGGNEHSPFRVLKYWLLQKVLRINGRVPWPVHPTTLVKEPQKIERGTRTPGLSIGCHIDGRNGIVFGPNVWVGPHVVIISMNHNVNNLHDYVTEGPIRIGKNSLLGAKCIILPGVELGEHTVVAAGAVVTKSFPEGNQILAGVPANIVKRLCSYNENNASNTPLVIHGERE